MFTSITGRIILGLATLLVAGLQYAYWFGEGGYYQHKQLLQDIGNQSEVNQELRERNRVLAAEVFDLKNGVEAIEEHARLDLGLIKPHETFVQMSMISKDYQPIYYNDIKVSKEDQITNETDEDGNP
ncbi:cell division protein FtsB [Acinetobacter qingfengensis]|uniref:Cell division protein FtsB n=1 Tax=Acinetobacter qingfengensis TaxID=1262585 RepID=A0A1E7QYP1_9GAMM|nr:septum formation initiator family protein [Acinetobacter qingfengensis]KAA8731409.1 cell division protein FtsB [Acinetobacter qingfengensis]OEY92187.1 cell division protein FtsB [Acinetobacter qingfengensis]